MGLGSTRTWTGLTMQHSLALNSLSSCLSLPSGGAAPKWITAPLPIGAGRERKTDVLYAAGAAALTVPIFSISFSIRYFIFHFLINFFKLK